MKVVMKTTVNTISGETYESKWCEPVDVGDISLDKARDEFLERLDLNDLGIIDDMGIIRCFRKERIDSVYIEIEEAS